MQGNIEGKKVILSKGNILIGLYLLFILMDVVAMSLLKNMGPKAIFTYSSIRVVIMVLPLMELSIKVMKLFFEEVKEDFDFCTDEYEDDYYFDEMEEEIEPEKLEKLKKIFILAAEIGIFTNVFIHTVTRFRDTLRNADCFDVNLLICLILMGTVSFVFRYYMNKRYEI